MRFFQTESIEILINGPLNTEVFTSLPKAFMIRFFAQGFQNRSGEAPGVPHFHEPAKTPMIQNLGRTAWAIRGDDGGPGRQGLCQHEREAFPKRAQHEHIRMGHVTDRVWKMAGHADLVLETELPDQTLEGFPLRTFAEEDQPHGAFPSRQGESPDEGGKILFGRQSSGSEDDRRAAALQPGMIRALGRLIEESWADDGIIDDPYPVRNPRVH